MNGLYDLSNNFRYYFDFYISVQEKSFLSASNKYNKASSSLLRNVRKLESLLNLKLIETNNRGFKLTNDGERLYKRLDLLFNNIENITSTQITQTLDITLSIGTTRNIADFVLSKYLIEFNKKYPNIKVQIYTDNATNLNDFLVNHKIDILIDYLPHINYSEKYDFEVMPLGEYKTCFATSKDYYDKVEVKDLKDLNKYSLIIPGKSRRRQMLDNILQTKNIKVNPILLMPDSKLMADVVKNTETIGYFIEEEAIEYGLKVLDLKEEMPVNAIGLIYQKHTLNKVASDFIEIVKSIS